MTGHDKGSGRVTLKKQPWLAQILATTLHPCTMAIAGDRSGYSTPCLQVWDWCSEMPHGRPGHAGT